MGNRGISVIWKLCLAVLLIGASVLPSATAQATEGQPPLMAPLSGSGPQSEVNLALGRPVTHSSQYSGGQSAWAVDGDENTSWIQLSADISDGEVWLTVDLGAATELDKAVIRWNTTKVQQYKIQHSADKLTWSDAYTSSGTVGNPEIARFPAVTDRYVRLLISGSGAVQEFELYLAGEEEQPEQPGPEVNLALGRPVTHSSQYSGGQSAWAVDGDENTSWIQLSADISDGEVWLTVDLGRSLQVNKYRVKWAASGVRQYKIQYSSDGTNWLDGYYRRGMVENDQSIVFNAVTGRYIRLQVDGSGAVAEFELYYAPEEPLSPTIDQWLREIEFVDADSNVWPADAARAIELGDNVQIGLRGYTYEGQLADLSVAQITYASLRPEIVSVSASGLATGVVGGVVRVEAEVELAGIQVTGGVYIQVLDREALVADLDLIHPTASFAIGQPALIGADQSYPSVVVTPGIPLTVTGELLRDGSAVYPIPEQQLSAGASQTVTLPGTASPGLYELRLELEDEDGRIRQDAFYFTVARSGWSQDDIDQLVFADGDELVSLPDHKGNRIMDFSDSGYGGGGVRIPDVPIRITLQPALTGDDTDRIQQAIDEVSALPLDRGGFRGTVLLEAGQYRVAGSLTIAASGVVLRGEGDGAEGTEIIATGAAVRPLIQLSGQAGPLLETSAAVEISDLYVPAGSRSFHVHDAGQLAVGDKVMIRRVGNDHWLHEIRMDRITPRPDSPPGTTNSWVPFDLEFDRVITAIDDQIVTVDAPIASPIEWRWGGGQIIPYTDIGRISHVGVENLKLTSEFDDTVTAVHRGQTYYADEAHASDAITLDRVVHAWVRNIEARHFYSGLAIVGRETKWITIQDSKALDMVSVITGGRRSPISLSGTLALVQRIYTETARHAFAVQSRVPGPNVFLDGVSIDEYGASEPHHRWSVGGLYDNVSGTIAIQDRAWLGSGQGWSGANYVTWNTTGELILQQAPTSQNYSIGHTGTFGIPVVPSSHDPYPRPDGYIARTGGHVEPSSLYRTQLSARLGPQAVAAIAAHPIETVYAPSWLAGELTAVPTTNGQVTLNWSGAYDSVSVTTYALYMDGELVADTSGTSYTISGLVPGAAHTFKVEAGNSAGWWSTDGPEEVVEIPVPAIGGMHDGTIVWPYGSMGMGQYRIDPSAAVQETDGSYWFVVPEDKHEAVLALSDWTGSGMTESELVLQFGGERLRIAAGELIELARAAGDSKLLSASLGRMSGAVAAGEETPLHLQRTLEDLVSDASVYALKLELLESDGRVAGQQDRTMTVKLELPSAWLAQSGSAKAADGPRVLSGGQRLGLYMQTGNRLWSYGGAVAFDRTGTTQSELQLTAGRSYVWLLPERFDDVSGLGDAERISVAVLSARQIVQGVSANRFMPDQSVTRAEFSVLLARALKLVGRGSGLPFRDVRHEDWFAPELTAAYERGFVNGISPELYDPLAPITREQMAVIVMRAWKLNGSHDVQEEDGHSRGVIRDRRSVSLWAADSVEQAVQAGLIDMTPAGDFAPQQAATRADAAKVLFNMWDRG